MTLRLTLRSHPRQRLHQCTHELISFISLAEMAAWVWIQHVRGLMGGRVCLGDFLRLNSEQEHHFVVEENKLLLGVFFPCSCFMDYKSKEFSQLAQSFRETTFTRISFADYGVEEKIK